MNTIPEVSKRGRHLLGNGIAMENHSILYNETMDHLPSGAATVRKIARKFRPGKFKGLEGLGLG